MMQGNLIIISQPRLDDEFCSTVPELNFSMCVIFPNEIKIHLSFRNVVKSLKLKFLVKLGLYQTFSQGKVCDHFTNL